jgi:ribosome-associated protein
MTDRRSFKKHDIDPEEALEGPSKSAVKREMTALQALGERLAALPDKQFQRIEFADEALAEAIAFYRAMPAKQHEARRRQLQFIGKRMRLAPTDGLQAQLDAMQGMDADEKRHHHQAEQWRERLLADPKALTEFLSQHQGESQQLNQLIRAAVKAKTQNTDRGEFRALYRALYDAIRH